MPLPTPPRSRRSTSPLRKRLAAIPEEPALAGHQRGRLQLPGARLRPARALPLADQRRRAGHAAAGPARHRRGAQEQDPGRVQREHHLRQARPPGRQGNRRPLRRRALRRFAERRARAGADLSQAAGSHGRRPSSKASASDAAPTGQPGGRRRAARPRGVAVGTRPDRHLSERHHRPARRLLRARPRHDLRAGRRQRQRQVHAVQGHHGLRQAATRRGAHRRAAGRARRCSATSSPTSRRRRRSTGTSPCWSRTW